MTKTVYRLRSSRHQTWLVASTATGHPAALWTYSVGDASHFSSPEAAYDLFNGQSFSISAFGTPPKSLRDVTVVEPVSVNLR